MPVPLPVARRAAWHRYMPPRIRGWLVVAGVVLLPAVLLLGSNALGPWLSAPGVALGNLTKLFALVGTAAFAVSLLLGARISWIARLLGGLDQLYRIHRWLGYSVLVSLLAHALLAAASLAIYSPTAGLLLFTPSAGWEVFLGVVALSGLIVVVLLPRLWQLKHERFLLLHRLVGVMFFLGSVHGLTVPAAKGLPTLLFGYLLGLIIAGLLAFVYRSILGRVLVRRYPYRIEQVNRLGSAAIELVLAPAKARMRFQPGQFLFITIVDDQVRRETHPFSITSSPGDPQLRLMIKALGDFTQRLQELRPGGRVLLEGPYGSFSYTDVPNRRQIWIAGGIGVTPFLSMARSIGSQPYQIDFYYCTEGSDDAFFLEEFFEISDRNPHFRVIPIRRASLGFITAEDIQSASGNVVEQDILMCGPPVMIHNLRQQFVARGVPSAQIHFEDFAVMSV